MKTVNRLMSVTLYVLMLAGLVLGICCIASNDHRVPKSAPSPEPKLFVGDVTVTFSGNPNIRESAGVSESNNLGTVKKDCTIEVGCYYVAEDWRNGAFYGFAVEDLIAAQGDNRWFPKRITKASIVWVNHRYVEITPTASPATTAPAA
ncbi:hypothetical protein IKF73_01865 [Candidatus Saccharibacteria bacterium]|nr:hypothetical protein [Candidatus Saccharibacteria bacterium]